MDVSNKYEAVFKPLYAYVQCDCPGVQGGSSSHIVFLFDAFGDYAKRFVICMVCRRGFKDDVHLKTQLGDFAGAALSHKKNATLIH